MKPRKNATHTIGSHALLPYASREADARMVHISEVERGLACGCVCPHCGAPLIAYKGEKKVDHFGHQPGAECAAGGALESMLHRLAKQIIAQRLEVYLPPVVARAGEREEPIAPGSVLRPDEVVEEVFMPGLRPDIVARVLGRELLIEIFVNHRCGPAKISLLRERNLACVEIDLSGLKDMTDGEEIEKAILHTAPRYWLHNPKVVERTSHWERQDEERRQRRLADARAAAQAINEAAVVPVGNAKPSPSAAWALQFVRDAALEEAANIPVDGEAVFAVPRTFWQAAILTQLERRSRGDVPPQTVDVLMDEAGLPTMVRAAAIRALQGRGLLWAEVAAYLEGHVRPPEAVVTDYFKLLSDIGLATRVGKQGAWVIPREARIRAGTLADAAREGRERLRPVEKAFNDAVRALGVSPGNFAGWLQQEHPVTDGISFTRQSSRPVARKLHDYIVGPASGGAAIVERLGRIAALARDSSTPVLDGLLGFPVEELNDRRRSENETEREAERTREALDEQRRTAIMARGRDGERYLDVLNQAERLLDRDTVAELVKEPLDCLGGFALSQIGQRLDEAEAAGVIERIRVLANAHGGSW